MIKAVLFDIDNVLYNSGHQVEMARAAAVEAMVREGLGMPIKEAHEKLEGIVRGRGPNFNKHYDLLVGERPNKAKIIAAGIVAYHDTKQMYVKPYDDTIPVLKKLKSSGYKLGVISDGVSVKQWEKLIRLGLCEMFETVVVSEDAGAEKPDPKPFLMACRNLDVTPDECLYVGDRLDTDIIGANKAGMVSVRLLRGKYKEDRPKNMQEQPKFEIKRLEELVTILKSV